MPLLLLFIVMPVVEIWLLFQIGYQIGALPTIALVLLTAMIGWQLLRQQGMQTYARLQQKMAQGQPPAQEMLEALALAVGGALLLTPGFVTDCLGLFCLLPGTRQLMIKALLKRLVLSQAGKMQGFSFTQAGPQPFTQAPFQDETSEAKFSLLDEDITAHSQAPQSFKRPHRGEVIDGDFERENKD